MKDNLEKAFKESLQEFEVSYDPKAWDAVRAGLDAKAASGSQAASGNALKWIVAAVITSVVAVGVFLLWPKQDKVEIVENQEIENKQTPIQEEDKNSSESEENVVLNDVQEEESHANTPDETKTTVPANTNVKEKAENSINENAKENSLPLIIDNSQVQVLVIDIPEGNTNVNIAGVVSSNTICLGESITLENKGTKNEIVSWMIEENGVVTRGELKSNEVAYYSPKGNVEAKFLDGKGNELESVRVTVNQLPVASFRYEANIYEDGVPVVNCNAYEDYASYVWNFDGNEVKGNASTTYHFFEKGDFEVSLHVTDRNGCKKESAQIVRINEKYNLMAPNGFVPNSTNSETNQFMPLALTLRDVNFHMTIVDPVTNEEVFATNNANEAWDGINQKTGKMVTMNKTYIWRVQIYNPLPNERPIYSGMIVPGLK